MRANHLGLVVLAAVGACAGNAPPQTADMTGASAQQAAAPTPGRTNRDVISQAELSTSSISGLTVMEAVKVLRPRFLTVRGLTTMPVKDPVTGAQLVDEEAGKVHVSIDGNKIVPLDELNGIRAGTIAEVQYLNAAQAMQRFGGTAREGPVILVKTIR